jgi:hypothetical protein
VAGASRRFNLVLPCFHRLEDGDRLTVFFFERSVEEGGIDRIGFKNGFLRIWNLVFHSYFPGKEKLIDIGF